MFVQQDRVFVVDTDHGVDGQGPAALHPVCRESSACEALYSLHRDADSCPQVGHRVVYTRCLRLLADSGSTLPHRLGIPQRPLCRRNCETSRPHPAYETRTPRAWSRGAPRATHASRQPRSVSRPSVRVLQISVVVVHVVTPLRFEQPMARLVR